MVDEEGFEASLTDLLQKTFGCVKRARSRFLYTKSGERILDLYLSGGAGLLGHRNKANTVFKNALDRVDCATFITESALALQKAVCAYLGKKVSIAPFYTFAEAKNATLNKGFILTAPIEVVPLYIAVFSEGEGFVKGEKLSPPIQVLAARSIYNLIKVAKSKEFDYCVHDKVLTKWWRREGYLLFPKIAKADYKEFATKALTQAKVFVSPFYEVPSIVPWDVEKGSLKGLERLGED